MQSIKLQEMTWPSVKTAIGSGFDTVVFAVGSTEQHGPHLPLSTDTLIGDWLAGAIAARLGNALVAPTVQVGCSEHHIAFAGTISLESQTLHDLLANYAKSLLKHGFRRVVIIPSHGGNFDVVTRVTIELQQQLPGKIVTFADLRQLVIASHQASAEFGISADASGAHAGEFETSIMLFLHPGLVDMKRAEQGFTGDITPLIPDLLQNGLAKVTVNGILGDGRPSDAKRGARYLEVWLNLAMAAIKSAAA
jgi:creatinine amidohydrolase